MGKRRGLERESFLHTGNFMKLRISTKQRCLREKGILAYGTSDRTEWRGNRRVGDFAQDGFSAGQGARAARAIFALLVGLNLGPGDRFPSSKREPGHRKKDCTGKAYRYLSLSVYFYLLVYVWGAEFIQFLAQLGS